MADKRADENVGETTTTLEEAQEKGFLGTHQDPRPNEDYTVKGVTSGGENPGPANSGPGADAPRRDDKPEPGSSSGKSSK